MAKGNSGKADKVLVTDLLSRLGREGQLEARRSEPPAHSAAMAAAMEAEGGAILVAPRVDEPRPRRHRKLYPVAALGGVVVTIGVLMLSVGFLGDIDDPDASGPVPAPEPVTETDGVAQTQLIQPAPAAPPADVVQTAGSPDAATPATRPATLSEVLNGFAGPAPDAGAAPAPAPAPAGAPAAPASPAAPAAPVPAGQPQSGLAPVLSPVAAVLNPLLLPLLR